MFFISLSVTNSRSKCIASLFLIAPVKICRREIVTWYLFSAQLLDNILLMP